MTSPAIRAIDKQIDANRAALLKTVGIAPIGAEGWQKAWEAHPNLHHRNRDLFRQRGIAQLERDRKASEQAACERRAALIKPPKKCPTCGCRTLVVA